MSLRGLETRASDYQLVSGVTGILAESLFVELQRSRPNLCATRAACLRPAACRLFSCGHRSAEPASRPAPPRLISANFFKTASSGELEAAPRAYAKMKCDRIQQHLSKIDARRLSRVEDKSWPTRSPTFSVLSENRQAGHNYFLMDRYEAGMVLTGTEVKAAKAGKIQLKESYAAISARKPGW